MIDKKYFRFLILTVSAVLLCFSLHLSASASISPPVGTLSFTGSTYDSSLDYCNSFDSVGGSVPSDYSLVALVVEPNDFANGSTRATYFYAPSSFTSITMYVNSQGCLVVSSAPNSSSFYYIMNRFDNQNNQTVVSGYTGSTGGRTTRNSNFIGFSYLPCYNGNGDIVLPPSLVRYELNTLVSTHFLYFNSKLLVGAADSCDYYIFPSSVDISGTSSSIISTPIEVTQLSSTQQQNIFEKGFNWWLRSVSLGHFGNKSDVVTVNSLSSSSSVNISSFNPDVYGLPYSFLGSSDFSAVDGGSESSTCFIDFKQIQRSGVYSYDNLCLVSVCRHEGLTYVARYDFSFSSFLADNVIPPNIIHSHFTAPSGTVSDLQDLADYLKNLADNNTENNRIGDENFIAMLGALPWSNFVSGGVSAGLDGWTPQLASELDNIFGSLFSDWINPSQEDIDDLINDLQNEKNELRSKLSFVSDVKTEVLFVHTAVLESGNTPPKFRVPLSVFWSGGSSSQADSIVIVDFESIPAIVITSIKNLITVFLSLSVILYIWRTLPSTIGNMPNDRGD